VAQKPPFIGDESIPVLAFCEHDETPAWLPPRGVTGLLIKQTKATRDRVEPVYAPFSFTPQEMTESR